MLLPFLLIFFLMVLFFSSGERFRTLEAIVNTDKPQIVGYGIEESNYRSIKRARLNYLPACPVVAIGSSRTLQFREFFFKERFYNAGYSVKNICDIEPFLSGLSKEKLPKILIIGLDQWMFNRQLGSEDFPYRHSAYWDEFRYFPTMRDTEELFSQLVCGRLEFAKLLSSDAEEIWTGVNACNFFGDGIRNDGSMRYAGKIRKIKKDGYGDWVFNETLNRVENGEELFSFGSHLNTTAIPELKRLLQYCKQNNIYVIGFLPPLASPVNNKIVRDGNHEYIPQIIPACKPLFRDFGFDIYDFQHPSAVGGSDREMLDGFHGGEVLYARMLLNMAQNSNTIGELVNPDLPSLIENRKSSLELIGD